MSRWDIPWSLPPEGEAWLRSLGVDDELLRNCELPNYWSGDEIIPVGHEGVRDFMPSVCLGPSYPSLTVDQIARAARLGLRLQIEPDRVFDFASIAEALPHVRGLRLVQGDDRGPLQFQSLHLLEGATRLETIWAGLDDEVDLSRLPRLVEATVWGRFSASVAANPAMRFLSLELPHFPDDFVIAGALRSLGIESGDVGDLGFVPDLTELRSLVVISRSTVDLRRLRDATNLEVLILVGSPAVLNVEVLTELPRLRRVNFDGHKRIPGYWSLAKLTAEEFIADPNYVFGDDFQAAVADRNWTITPQRSARAPKITPRSRARMEDGVDVVTFRPFDLERVSDGYELSFSDWTAGAIGFTPDDFDSDAIVHAIERLLDEELPALMASGAVSLDSESDAAYVKTSGLEDAEAIARVISAAWWDPEGRFARVLHSAGAAEDARE